MLSQGSALVPLQIPCPGSSRVFDSNRSPGTVGISIRPSKYWVRIRSRPLFVIRAVVQGMHPATVGLTFFSSESSSNPCPGPAGAQGVRPAHLLRLVRTRVALRPTMTSTKTGMAEPPLREVWLGTRGLGQGTILLSSLARANADQWSRQSPGSLPGTWIRLVTVRGTRLDTHSESGRAAKARRGRPEAGFFDRNFLHKRHISWPLHICSIRGLGFRRETVPPRGSLDEMVGAVFGTSWCLSFFYSSGARLVISCT